jgi:hypothetical protein
MCLPCVLYRDQIRPGFPEAVTVLWLLQSSVPGPRKIRFRTANARVCPRHTNTTFLTMHTDILTTLQWERTFIEVEQPSTEH